MEIWFAVLPTILQHYLFFFYWYLRRCIYYLNLRQAQKLFYLFLYLLPVLPLFFTFTKLLLTKFFTKMENDFTQTHQAQNPGNYYYNSPLNNLPNATAVLVLGIVSIPTCFCYGIVGLACGIIALVLAKSDFALLKAHPEKYTQVSVKNLQAGKTCAIVGVSVSGVFLLFIIGYLIIWGTLITSILSNHQVFNH